MTPDIERATVIEVLPHTLTAHVVPEGSETPITVRILESGYNLCWKIRWSFRRYVLEFPERVFCWNLKRRRYYLRYQPYTDGDGRVYAYKAWFNANDVYIGDERMVRFICREYGIRPEPMPSEYRCDGQDGKVCCIGKSDTDGKWYGWSHRAIAGFAIGDVVSEGDCTSESGYTEQFRAMFPATELPVGFVAKTDEDCKRMAIAFAGNVG